MFLVIDSECKIIKNLRNTLFNYEILLQKSYNNFNDGVNSGVSSAIAVEISGKRVGTSLTVDSG